MDRSFVSLFLHDLLFVFFHNIPPLITGFFCYQLLNQPGHTHHILSPPPVWNSCVAQKPVAAHPMGYLLEIPLSNARPKKKSSKKFPPSPNGHCLKDFPPSSKWIYYPQNSSKILREQFNLPPQVSARRRCLVFAPKKKLHFFVGRTSSGATWSSWMAKSPSRMGNSVATMPMRLPWEIQWFVLPVVPKRPRVVFVLAWRLKRQMKLGWLWNFRDGLLFVFFGGGRGEKKGDVETTNGEGKKDEICFWLVDGLNLMWRFFFLWFPCYVYLTVVYLCLFYERHPTMFWSTTCSMSSACPQNVLKIQRVWFHSTHLTMILYAGSSPKNGQHTSNM